MRRRRRQRKRHFQNEPWSFLKMSNVGELPWSWKRELCTESRSVEGRDGNENFARKVNLGSCSLACDYSFLMTSPKCKRTLLQLNSQGQNPSSERETQFSRHLFTSSIKRKIGQFYLVVLHKRHINVQKTNQNLLFFYVLIAVASLIFKSLSNALWYFRTLKYVIEHLPLFLSTIRNSVLDNDHIACCISLCT